MDIKRKRELLEAYKNRHPEMGVIALCCTATGDLFFGASKDTKADFNSIRFKLDSGTHPNKPLGQLWKQYGESGFILSVVSIFKYDDPQADHTEELEALLVLHLTDAPQARRIWR